MAPELDDPPADDLWWREAVLYQIYPRSFADSDGDGVGDLPGIVAHLDHLTDLGVDAIWLSPFYPSPQEDFGYDVSDYTDVDPAYGTLADFDRLAAAARARGIRVIVDLVMNHTSRAHPWFQRSRASRDNPWRDWYFWADPAPDGGPPNNWLSAFERCGPGWTYDEPTGQYYLHSFTPGQPDLNWRNPEVARAMADIWRFWLDRGASGFRVDVAHRLMKDELLRDNLPEVAQARRHVSHAVRQRQMDLPEVHEVLGLLRKTADTYPGSFLLGEVPIADPARLARYLGGDGMHSVFHIGFWEQPWQAGAFADEIDQLNAELAPGALAVYALGTHDITRVGARYGVSRARVAAMMQLTLRGIPCVYYGDEIGMTGLVPGPDQERDVDGRDEARTAMQWDGVEPARSWLPVPPSHVEVNVARQRHDPGSLLAFYRTLIAYRKRSPALRRGGYRRLATSEPVFAYLRELDGRELDGREADGERLLVALNFAGVATSVDLTGLASRGRVELSTLSGATEVELDAGSVRLRPDEGVVVRLLGEDAAQ